jgi:hypothetical protein
LPRCPVEARHEHGANHHRRPFPGEEFQMFEKDLPGGRTADFNKDSEIGAWMAKNGEAIYGTRAGPVGPRAWGVTTRKGNRVYVHVLDAPDSALLLPPLGARVRSARILTAGRRAEFSEHDFGVVVKLPGDAIDPIDTIVELTLSS